MLVNTIVTENVDDAVEYLRAGRLVAFPTETVYGLGADAMNESAVRGVFSVKGRPASHPLIVHIGDAKYLEVFAKNITDSARILAEKFWPGSLTLVLDKTDQVPEVVTGGQSSVALRFPSHPIARDLLSKFGGGVVGPSANKFGRLSPTQPKDVLSDLGGDIDLVLDGGACTVGIESTIVGFDGNTPVLLRPGMITTEEISSVLSVSVELAGERAPRVSGSLPSHYAPNTPLILVKPNLLKSEIERRLSKNDRIAVLAFSDLSSFADQLHYAEVSSDAKVYARTLYHELRELDQKKCDVILVEEVPMTNPWSGIRDRLLRAACR